MYADKNYKTKKDLKANIAAGVAVTFHSPGPYPAPTDGRVTLEGPHYPQPHRWYAQCIAKDGKIISAK